MEKMEVLRNGNFSNWSLKNKNKQEFVNTLQKKWVISKCKASKSRIPTKALVLKEC